MKLTELEPRWVESRWDALSGIKFGLTFQCPHCKKIRIGILFDPPIGNTDLIAQAVWADPRMPDTNVWKRQGKTFENITISPSVDVSIDGHWHGFINNGEVT